MLGKRVAVFIDHSNVVHRLIEMRLLDKSWIRWYNPTFLAKSLCGGRELSGVHFYCAPPPPYLLTGTELEKDKYWEQMRYYSLIEKLDGVELKYASVKGVRGSIVEKNLDTQLNSDMLLKSISNDFDVAILVSNDGDYVSALNGVRTLGRRVELGYFKGKCSMDLKRSSDLSRRLRKNYFITLDGMV